MYILLGEARNGTLNHKSFYKHTMNDEHQPTNAATHLASPPAMYHLYVPNNLDELIEQKVKGASWLDFKLRQEIELGRPEQTDIDFEGKRNVERLSIECSKLFVPGREFCCKFQLHAMLEAFATHWAFNIATSGNKFKCSFAPADKKPIGGQKSKLSPSKR